MNKSRKKYIRDGRAPIPKSEAVSRVMSANKGTGTGPEVTFRRALWKAGLKGYRKNWKKVPGRPDIVFVTKKVAIFVNGCYWHRCPKCKLPLPKSNKEFWKKKFARNKARDKKKLEELQQLGWKTTVVWECEIKNDMKAVVKKVMKLIQT